MLWNQNNLINFFVTIFTYALKSLNDASYRHKWKTNNLKLMIHLNFFYKVFREWIRTHLLYSWRISSWICSNIWFDCKFSLTCNRSVWRKSVSASRVRICISSSNPVSSRNVKKLVSHKKIVYSNKQPIVTEKSI